MENSWFKKDYRRNLVDMHITAFDKNFLSKFDAKQYVETVAKANVSSLLFYANSHVGYCNWPTRMGGEHPNLKGRDFVGDVIQEAHRRGINVSLYYSLVFNNWAVENHPEWMSKKSNGEPIFGLDVPRYKIACMNNQGYRDFTKKQVQELCTGYDFEGIWFDMTFWAGICYCDSCKERYKEETGKEIPTYIDWQNKEWIAFQRKREEWLNDFAAFATDAVKKIKPNVSVTHQCVSYLAGWSIGSNIDFSNHTDFMAGDLYGDKIYQSFNAKVYNAVTENKPFEYMTSRCVNLGSHTLSKEIEELEASAFSAIANGGSFLFIDAIDPSGEIHPRIYEKMATVYDQIERIEAKVGGEMMFDIALYFSTASRIPLLQKGEVDTYEVRKSWDMDFGMSKEVYPDMYLMLNKDLSKIPTNHGMVSKDIAKTLIENSYPFGVVTKKNIQELNSVELLILPEVITLDDEEIEAIKSFVSKGGKILATRNTSLHNPEGPLQKFGLEEVFGAKFAGMQNYMTSYMTPTITGKEIFSPYDEKSPLCIKFDLQTKVIPMEETEVLATFTPPINDINENENFASIHSNPPASTIDDPTAILNNYGKGKSLYVTANFNLKYAELSNVFMSMIDSLLPDQKLLYTNAPKPVEITMFEKKEDHAYLIHLVNFQESFPNIPVHDIEISARVQKKPIKAKLLTEDRDIEFKYEDDYITFNVEKLETYQLISIQY